MLLVSLSAANDEVNNGSLACKTLGNNLAAKLHLRHQTPQLIRQCSIDVQSFVDH